MFRKNTWCVCISSELCAICRIKIVLNQKRQIFFKVKLMQLIRRILPPMSNEVITLVKDTSLANTIALTEVIWAGEKFMKSAGLAWPLFFTGVYYLAFTGILTILFSQLEKKIGYYLI